MNAVYNTPLAASMAAALSANANMASDKTQMRLYLDHLKAMVPQGPRNHSVSRQNLIEHVINSISNLQDTQDSDSEDDSRPGSPFNDVPLSDSFSHQPQQGAYGVQPHDYSSCQGLYSNATYNSANLQQGQVYQHDYNSASFTSSGSSSGHSESYSSGYNGDGSSFSGYSYGSPYMN